MERRGVIVLWAYSLFDQAVMLSVIDRISLSMRAGYVSPGLFIDHDR